MKKILLLLLLTIGIFRITVFGQYYGPCYAPDSLVLVALYNSTGGPNWTQPWNLNTPVQNWYGNGGGGSILLDNNGRVLSITIEYNNLVGSIPSSIGNLADLSFLSLRNNQLSGGIPSSIGNLGSLENLDLSSNQLSDTIPASIGNIIPQSATIPGLFVLNLYNNQLSGRIPSSLGNITNLSTLDLHNNQLIDTIPASIGNIFTPSKTSLAYLDLSSNQLTGGIPSSLGNLFNLLQLHLNNNELSGNIPVSLANLTTMDSLNLSYNQLGGGIPSVLGNLSTSLSSMRLAHNQLSGNIPSSLGSLSKTAFGMLDLSYNALNGAIPSSLGNLSGLGILNLNNNVLTDSIPSSLGNLDHLVTLDLSNNQLSDSIPSALGNSLALGSYARLVTLNLSHNQLSGSIPASLGNLMAYALSYMDLSYNQLTGSIPASLANDQAIVTLSLNNNKLSDSIPAALSTASYYYIKAMSIAANQLTFSGMEGVAQAFSFLQYSPQAYITLYQTGSKLYVSAGGTPANNTYRWYSGSTLVATNNGDSTFTPTASGNYSVTVTNAIATQLTLYSDTLNPFAVGPPPIMPCIPHTEHATSESTDGSGWTNYYDGDTLLLSLQKNGQNIGTVGDGTFDVKLVATAGAGSGTGIAVVNPLITNTSGYWAMNRYWNVTATHEPTSDVGVRFYYNNKDLADVNGSYPTHDLSNQQLIFYKETGGNPDPTTNIAGATAIISIMPSTTVASDNTWTYTQLTDSTQYAEFSVTGFSGGGGGGTGNDLPLPVTLLSFTATKEVGQNLVQWSTTSEINSSYFEVERSTDGVSFTGIGTVNAAGTSNSTIDYSFTDNALPTSGNSMAGNIYYRLTIVDKDGHFTYSNIVLLNENGITAALSLYPNPTTNTALLTFSAAAANKYAIVITDLAGRTIKRIDIPAFTGTNTVTIDLGGCAQGTYLITLTDNAGSKQTVKLNKQ